MPHLKDLRPSRKAHTPIQRTTQNRAEKGLRWDLELELHASHVENAYRFSCSFEKMEWLRTTIGLWFRDLPDLPVVTPKK